MDVRIEFIFRNKRSTCKVYPDKGTIPCYFFAELNDADLIAEFGDEIAIKTDLVKRLPKKDDYPSLIDLRESIFTAIKLKPELIGNMQNISDKNDKAVL
jgi:hypothetical protein